MVTFQREYRPQHADVDELWGTWGPDDDVFRFAFERRMLRHDHSDAALSLTFAVGLTPARQTLTGSAQLVTERNIRATDGFRAISRAAVLDRTLSLRGGEPLTT